MLTRSLSGLVFIVLVLGSIWLGKIAFGILMLLFTLICLYEFCQLVNTHRNARTNLWLCLIGGAVLSVAAWMYLYLNVRPSLPVAVPAVLMLLLLDTLRRHRKAGIETLAYSLMALGYIALPLSFFHALAVCAVDGTNGFHAELLYGFFAFIWMSDTFAYLTGRFIGRHRMSPELSPKKTWEGLAGGLLFAVAAGYGASYLWPDTLSPLRWMGLAFTVSLAGVAGDLFESFLKRQVGVKDSGRIMPGHGGLLDRLDSSLVALPCALIYLAVLA